jgi:hypothetical protein
MLNCSAIFINTAAEPRHICQEINGRKQNPYMDKYTEIMNDWNSDTCCTVTSLLVWDLEKFRHTSF